MEANPTHLRTTARVCLEEELSNLRLGAEHERTAQERRKRKLEAERKALLDAHLAEAAPLDLLKDKQDGITAKLAAVERRLAEIAADFQKAETNLKRALARVGDCETAYREASDTVRRQFNLAFFDRLLIDEDYTVHGELAPPFDVILGDELRRRAASAEADEATRQPSRKPYASATSKSRPGASSAHKKFSRAQTHPRPLPRSWVGVRTIWWS